MVREKIRPSELAKMSVSDVFADERVSSRFTEVASAKFGDEKGKQMFIRERQAFLSIISENEDLQKCTGDSAFSAFMEIALMGLSVARQKHPLAYLIPYKFNKGTPNELMRMRIEVSPYGELASRINDDIIKDCDNPTLVYEGDEFRVYTDHGKKVVDYEKKHDPNKKRKLIAGFIRIVKQSGETEFFIMDMQDIERLRKYSEKKNKGKGANPLYTSNNGQIDEGFFVAKIIKHAFAAYPKAPYMQHLKSTVIQSDKDDDLIDLISPDDEEKPEVEEAEAKDITDEENTENNNEEVESY